MHALYFIGYATMASVAGMVVAQAQYSRKKNEGTPMSFGFLKAISIVAVFMWTAAGVTTVAYS